MNRSIPHSTVPPGNTAVISQAQLQAEFGERIAARLDMGAKVLPHDVTARLFAIRLQAVGRRKPARVANVRARTASAVFGSGNTASMSMGGAGGPGFWRRIASGLPLVVLVAGLFTIHMVQNEDRLRELAEVDTDLLTDDLPPAAYTDPGFIEFLKNGLQQTERQDR